MCSCRNSTAWSHCLREKMNQMAGKSEYSASCSVTSVTRGIRRRLNSFNCKTRAAHTLLLVCVVAALRHQPV